MEAVLDFVRSSPLDWALLVVFAAAALEYLLPPLPADSVVLAGALLVVAGKTSFPVVYMTAVAGGVLGAFTHYMLGQRLAGADGHLRGGRWLERIVGEDALPKFFEAFRRHGMWVIAANRAFPGVRAVTFLAAGAARLPLAWVMLAGLVSNLAWTGLVLGVGVSVGASWEEISAAFETWQRAVLTAGAVLGAVALALLLRRRRTRER